MPVSFDFLVVGGGLAGLASAYKLGLAGRSVALIDYGLPASAGKLGGFARFSGAKFSLLPAGQGLIDVAGSKQHLEAVILSALKLLDLDRRSTSSAVCTEDQELPNGLKLRSYTSIVLSPQDIDCLIDHATQLAGSLTTLIRATIGRLTRTADTNWTVFDEADREIASARCVIACGGRTNGALLRNAGAEPQDGRGLDVGIRAEFLDKRALTSLRALGPDAKILGGRCRTFCLNSPGTIYRYRWGPISIPGGIVAGPSTPTANVGLLYRTDDRMAMRPRILSRLRSIARSEYENAKLEVTRGFRQTSSLLEHIYGPEIASELIIFANSLEDAGLIDWNYPHHLHLPLLDWHWDTFALKRSHKTSLSGLYVAGDVAGHARGLLQASVSGLLAADEALRDTARAAD